MRALLTILLAALLPLAACTPRPKPLPPGAIRAVVSIPPLKGLIEPLLPPGSTIEVLIPPGASEHGSEIPSDKLAALNTADLVVVVGLGLEPLVEKYLTANPNPARRVVRFTEIKLDDKQLPSFQSPPAPAHDHADGHEHEHAADPHIWLDPIAARTLCWEVTAQIKALLKDKPGFDSSTLDAALAAQYVELIKLHAEYELAFATVPPERRTIVAAHDAYGWLAKRYNLTIIPIAGLEAAEPKAADIDRAVKEIKKLGITTVFTEPQLSEAAAKLIAQQTGAKLVPLDPLGDGDYFKMMRQNLIALKSALTPDKP